MAVRKACSASFVGVGVSRTLNSHEFLMASKSMCCLGFTLTSSIFRLKTVSPCLVIKTTSGTALSLCTGPVRDRASVQPNCCAGRPVRQGQCAAKLLCRPPRQRQGQCAAKLLCRSPRQTGPVCSQTVVPAGYTDIISLLMPSIYRSLRPV